MESFAILYIIEMAGDDDVRLMGFLSCDHVFVSPVKLNVITWVTSDTRK